MELEKNSIIGPKNYFVIIRNFLLSTVRSLLNGVKTYLLG